MTHEDDELLSEPLPARRRGKRMTRTGVALAAVIIAGAGFVGGVQVQKASGDGGGTGFAGGPPGGGTFTGGGQGPGGAQGQAADGATVGEVSSVEGTTIYVEDASGNTVRVRAGKKAKVSRNAVADADEIHPGDTVIVQGRKADSGTVVATSVVATASNADSAAGLFGGRGAGATPPAGAPGDG